MSKFAIIMWLMIGPYHGVSSDSLKEWLYSTRSDCQEMAYHLNHHGFSGNRCIPVKVTQS